jgi:orotate phosphoribosyltransferase
MYICKKNHFTMKSISENTAKKLLEVGAVQFNFQKPFQWASGWFSPIYCDCRLTLSFPKVRSFLKENFAILTKEHFANVEIIAGVATAGIPQASLIADYLEKPMLYVRSSPKAHGKGNLIEGKIEKNQKVVVIEDIISTGGSSLQAVRALQDAGAEVLGVLAIMNYGFENAQMQFQEANIPLVTLTDYTQLLVEISKIQDIDEQTMASLHAWRRNPQEWGR